MGEKAKLAAARERRDKAATEQAELAVASVEAAIEMHTGSRA
jgi:hypothetical protein